MSSRIYLDNHTATKPCKEAVDILHFMNREKWASITSPHQMGQELYPHVDSSIEDLYVLLGAPDTYSFCLTSGTQENLSQILFSHYIDVVRETGKNQFLTLETEDVFSFSALRRLETLGCSYKMMPLDENGHLTPSTLESFLKPRTSLLTMSWASSLTGVIQPLEEITAFCKEKEIRLHLEASAVIGKLFFRLQDMDCDLLSFDGIKIHAPQGSGAIFSKNSSPSALKTNPHVPMLLALTEAVKKTNEQFDFVATETARLRHKLEAELKKTIPDTLVLFENIERLPHLSLLSFPGVCNEALLFLLHRQGVYASIGGGVSQTIAHILKACHFPEEIAFSSLSFSLSYTTTEEEIDRALEVIVSSVKKLRAIGEKC